MKREEREKLLKHLKYNHSIGADYTITDKDADEIIKLLEQEPKTGHWTKMFLTDTSDIDCQCSECGFIHVFINGHTAQYNYCPNCGARMVEPKESDHKCHTCHTCKHYTSGEHDGSCGSYICKEYSNWESEVRNE